MTTLQSRFSNYTATLFAAALLCAQPFAVIGADEPEAWADKPGFQRGEGGPADTGDAGEKCQDISDANRKKECVRKARIKTETAVEKKEIEQEASSAAEAEKMKAKLDKEAKEKEKEVEKAAKEAEKKEREAAGAASAAPAP